MTTAKQDDPQPPTLVIRACPILPFVIAFVLASLWCIQYFGGLTIVEYHIVGYEGVPDNELLAWITIPICLYSLSYGLFHTSHTIAIRGDQLIRRNWFRHQAIALADIAELGLHQKSLDQRWRPWLTVWGHKQDQSPLMRIDLTHFFLGEVQALIRYLEQRQPSIQINRELLYYLS